eukprot:7732907-Pyramimonas_sp.AAC.1
MAPKRKRGTSPVRPWYEDDSGPDDDIQYNQRQKEAGEACVEEIIDAYLRGKPMNARLFCVLCYWAGKAGVKEAR